MPAERWRVFLDTNVLIAGLVSQTGASAAIRDLGEAEEILVVLSQQVLIEADRVILAKFPPLIDRHRAFIKNLKPLLVDNPPASLVREAARIIHPDDAPILAAAKLGPIDYLVTLDTRHFHILEVRAFLAVPILTPAEFLSVFRDFWERRAGASS